MTSPVDRFIALTNEATRLDLHGDVFTDRGLERALALLREAEAPARVIATFGHPLDPVSHPLSEFCDRKRQTAIADPDALDPDGTTALQEASYYVGLVVGLLIAERQR